MTDLFKPYREQLSDIAHSDEPHEVLLNVVDWLRSMIETFPGDVTAPTTAALANAFVESADVTIGLDEPTPVGQALEKLNPRYAGELSGFFNALEAYDDQTEQLALFCENLHPGASNRLLQHLLCPLIDPKAFPEASLTREGQHQAIEFAYLVGPDYQQGFYHWGVAVSKTRTNRKEEK